MKTLILLSFLLVVCYAQPPKLINFTLPFMVPEGIEYDPTLGFLLGSNYLNSVYKVNDQGVYTNITTNPQFLGVIGLQLDPTRNLLLAAITNWTSISRVFGGDAGGPFYNALAKIRLTDNTLQQLIVLEQGQALSFANDVAVDNAGNAYITDSFGAKIWKVDLAGNVTVYANDSRWVSSGVGLNGIDYNTAGDFLIAVDSTTGKLYKLRNSTTITVVNAPLVPNGDGIYFQTPTDLLVVQNSNAKVAWLKSSDNWVTATLYQEVNTTAPGTPTTVTVRNGYPYVIHTYFNYPPPSDYYIERIDFATLSTTGVTNAPTTGATTNAPTTGATTGATTGPAVSTTAAASTTGAAVTTTGNAMTVLPSIVLLIAMIAVSLF